MAVSDELLTYFQQIRRRGSVRRREWYWPKNAHRPKWLAYTLEYEPFTLVLKVIQYIQRRRKLALVTRSQRPLTRSLRPIGELRPLRQPSVVRDPQRQGTFVVNVEAENLTSATTAQPAGSGEQLDPVAQIRLGSGNRRLILAHVFFETEAKNIFDKLAAFFDYDQIVTTSVPSLRDTFLEQLDPWRAACLFVPNSGRDVMPFLLALATLDLSGYDHFVKVHTKRSVHLAHGADWFGMNLDALLGEKRMTDQLLDRIDPRKPSLYGLQTLPLRDHVVQNRHWLKHLAGRHAAFLRGRFIPGTMFAGSGQYLRELAALNLHLKPVEPETGQLDGTYVHALERYFGFFARCRGGECRTIESLLTATA